MWLSSPAGSAGEGGQYLANIPGVITTIIVVASLDSIKHDNMG